MLMPINPYKTIPINDLRRVFGEIEANLPYIDGYILTKNGKPFATLSATLDVKRDILKETLGSFKNTDLDSDEIWSDVLKKKSRKKKITL